MENSNEKHKRLRPFRLLVWSMIIISVSMFFLARAYNQTLAMVIFAVLIWSLVIYNSSISKKDISNKMLNYLGALGASSYFFIAFDIIRKSGLSGELLDPIIMAITFLVLLVSGKVGITS